MEYTSENPIFVRICEKMQTKGEISTDFILPDSFEDIRKIIHASASLCPERGELSSNKLISKGKLWVNVLFEDDTGRIDSAEFSRDYQISCAAERSDSESVYLCLPTVESVNIKLLNPRKVGARITVDTNAKIWEERQSGVQMPEGFTASDRLSVEKKEEYTDQLCVFSVYDMSREISEDIELERALPAIERMLLSDLSISADRVSRSGDLLELKGEAVLDLLYEDAEKNIISKRISLPFAQSMEAKGLPEGENTQYFAQIYVDRKSTLPAENAFGENKTVELDASCTMHVAVLQPCKVRLTRDAFSTEYCTKNITSQYRTAIMSAEDKISLSRSVSGEWEEDKKAVCVFSECLGVNEGAGNMQVKLKFTVLYENSNSGHGALVISDSLVPEFAQMSECFCQYLVDDPRLTVENGRAEISYTLTGRAVGWNMCESTCVSSMELCENGDDKEYKPISVYYPQKDETLWDVAKKYRVSENALMCANAVTDPEQMKRVLIIPRRRRAVFSKII